MTLNWQDFNMLVFMSRMSPRDDKGSKPKGWNRGNAKLARYWKSKLQLNRYGIEIKTDSLQNDGTESWIVISSVNKCVTSRREQETHSLRRCPNSRGKIGCDETKGTIYTVFIFIFIFIIVDYRTDQSTGMERYIRR